MTHYLPDGLMEAVKDGQVDAVIDLANYLMDINDPRGLDILWVSRSTGTRYWYRSVMERLQSYCCPKCGEPARSPLTHPNHRCEVNLLVMLPSGTVTTIDNCCDWSGLPTELLPPLMKDG